MSKRDNWNNPDVPKDDWLRTGVENSERGGPPEYFYIQISRCDMCGQLDRHHYLNIMEHPTHLKMKVCCLCKSRMTRNYKSFCRQSWWTTPKGNPETIADHHYVNLFRRGDGWSACVAADLGHFQRGEATFLPTTHATQDGAKRAAFDLLCSITEEWHCKWLEERTAWRKDWNATRRAAMLWLRSYLADGAKDPDSWQGWQGDADLGVPDRAPRIGIYEVGKGLGHDKETIIDAAELLKIQRVEVLHDGKYFDHYVPWENPGREKGGSPYGHSYGNGWCLPELAGPYVEAKAKRDASEKEYWRPINDRIKQSIAARKKAKAA